MGCLQWTTPSRYSKYESMLSKFGHWVINTNLRRVYLQICPTEFLHRHTNADDAW